MSAPSYDLAVVGAGPAGSTAALAALTLDPSLRVLLLDRADFPRDKCCGDGIAPHVRDVLARVGAEDAVDGWTPLTRLDLSRGENTVAGTMPRPVWVIPREVFDARLVDHAVARGADLVRHRVARVRPTADGFDVDGVATARMVVGADGVHSVVREALGCPRTARRALALRGYAPTPASRRGLQVIRYGDRRQPSYAWSFDRGDGLANVGYGELVGDDTGAGPPTRRMMLDQLEKLLPGSTAGGTGWRGHHLPLSGWSWQQPDGAALLAGDAAGLVNPMTGEGIYYAVATGLLAGSTAATAVRRGLCAEAGARHRRRVRRLLAWHLRHTWVTSHLSRSPAVVDAGIRAAARSPRAFDDLVEIGLGDGLITPRLAGGLVTGLVTGLATSLATARPGHRRAG